MLNEKNITYIKNEITTLVSLARILETNYDSNSDIEFADLWALVVILKANLEELLKYLNNLCKKTKTTQP
ncbi:MAG: hypothetical protein KHX03_05930 [Clostridium sp.]|nr:hypothetical protein [Clostridium sp.]